MANSIPVMYPGYKLYVTTEYGKQFQIATVCEKRKNRRSLWGSEVVGV